jgi:hypothetical protein
VNSSRWPDRNGHSKSVDAAAVVVTLVVDGFGLQEHTVAVRLFRMLHVRAVGDVETRNADASRVCRIFAILLALFG